VLARKLTRIADDAIPSSGFQQLPTSVRSVLADVFAHPDSSIDEISTRTGFPQSHVSGSVARLRQSGVLVTKVDPRDRRRTLVHPAPGLFERSVRVASGTIDDAVARILGADDPVRLAEVLAALDLLARRLTPKATARIRGAHAQPAGTEVATT